MERFWIVRDGQRVGPFDEAEVLRGYESGALRPDDLLVGEHGGPGATVDAVFDQLRRDILTSPTLLLEPLDEPGAAGSAAPQPAR
jgi:hypothetical protein